MFIPVNSLQLYWCGWEHPATIIVPLRYPPNPNILAYWTTGSGELCDLSTNYQTVGYNTYTGIIAAENEIAAQMMIESDFPNMNLRFLRTFVPSDAQNDRFALADMSWSSMRVNHFMQTGQLLNRHAAGFYGDGWFSVTYLNGGQ
jgi:hypothetical protein